MIHVFTPPRQRQRETFAKETGAFAASSIDELVTKAQAAARGLADGPCRCNGSDAKRGREPTAEGGHRH